MPDRISDSDNGNRWKGAVEMQIKDMRRDLDRVEGAEARCQTAVNADLDAVHSRITRLEIKVAWYAGAFSLLGGAIGGVIATIASHLVGE